MKKFILLLFIIIIGAAAVYFSLDKLDFLKKEEPVKKVQNKKNNEANTKKISSKDDFIEEAIKLQTLAENKENNSTCRCYQVKELDPNSNMEGSILVYTVDDLFVSNMWLSNGTYLLDGFENASPALVETSSDSASKYCGESSYGVTSSLCAKNY